MKRRLLSLNSIQEKKSIDTAISVEELSQITDEAVLEEENRQKRQNTSVASEEDTHELDSGTAEENLRDDHGAVSTISQEERVYIYF